MGRWPLGAQGLQGRGLISSLPAGLTQAKEKDQEHAANSRRQGKTYNQVLNVFEYGVYLGARYNYCVMKLGAQGLSKIQQWELHAFEDGFSSLLAFDVGKCVTLILIIPATIILRDRQTEDRDTER